MGNGGESGKKQPRSDEDVTFYYQAATLEWDFSLNTHPTG